ncbi:MAG: hypothetical protein B7X06_00875 [Verrucomicrobia bacterium 21-51-4]|nr:MAG: hypothetical protein B7X06_00875 [Verrucomicrobia bacterium 21-51-4]HQU08433.1 dihydrofolate reductase [Opitutales bacterium]
MQKKSWKAIAAIALNHVMGKDGKLPWNIPEDLAWFKEATSGHAIVMGRKTFDSINRRLLPNRKTIIVSRTLKPLDVPAGAIVISSLEELDTLEISTDIFIVGGAEIYAAALPRCSDL